MNRDLRCIQLSPCIFYSLKSDLPKYSEDWSLVNPLDNRMKRRWDKSQPSQAVTH
jgi:hypothetical protein